MRWKRFVAASGTKPSFEPGMQRIATSYGYEEPSLGSSERFEFMKVLTLVAGAVLLCIAPVFARPANPSAGPQNPPAAAATQSNAVVPQTTVPAAGAFTQEGPGAAPLRVMVGKSL